MITPMIFSVPRDAEERLSRFVQATDDIYEQYQV